MIWPDTSITIRKECQEKYKSITRTAEGGLHFVLWNNLPVSKYVGFEPGA